MNRRGKRQMRGVMVAGTIAVGLVIPAPAAQAEHGPCGSATHAVPNNPVPNQSVSPSDLNDWWRHQAILPSHTYTMQPYGGNADLEVYNSSCTRVCRSALSGTATERCSGVAGTGYFYIRVIYVNSPGGAAVGYTLQESNP